MGRGRTDRNGCDDLNCFARYLKEHSELEERRRGKKARSSQRRENRSSVEGREKEGNERYLQGYQASRRSHSRENPCRAPSERKGRREEGRERRCRLRSRSEGQLQPSQEGESTA